MKPGTLVRLPDGREGRVVYHGLDGYGIKFGTASVDVIAILKSNSFSKPDGVDIPEPEAMLRKPYAAASCECVGEEFEVISEVHA